MRFFASSPATCDVVVVTTTVKLSAAVWADHSSGTELGNLSFHHRARVGKVKTGQMIVAKQVDVKTAVVLFYLYSAL